jgi:hypothetical protein
MPISVDHKKIKSTFTKYFQHLAKHEHSKAIDHIYPPLFKLIPKKTLLSTMKQGDKSVVIKLTGLSIEKISSPKSKKEVQYVVLDYSYTLTMIFPEPPIDPEEEIDELPEEKENEQLVFTFEILKDKYGKKNVTIDHDRLTLKANVKSQVYCILDPAYQGWKFLEKKKKGMEGLLEKLGEQS